MSFPFTEICDAVASDGIKFLADLFKLIEGGPMLRSVMKTTLDTFLADMQDVYNKTLWNQTIRELINHLDRSIRRYGFQVKDDKIQNTDEYDQNSERLDEINCSIPKADRDELISMRYSLDVCMGQYIFVEDAIRIQEIRKLIELRLE